MNIFSLIYDPVTSTPFAIKVVNQEATGFYGLTNAGRDWAQSSKSIPSGMIQTAYAPLTESAKQKMAPMVSGDEFIPMDELKEYVFPSLNHKSRKLLPETNGTSVELGPLHFFSGKNKVRAIEFKALNFNRMRNQGSAISEIKVSGVFFDSLSNLPKTTSSNDDDNWKSERIISILGTGTSRRMGIKSRQNYGKPDSDNQRINRRVKNLIGEDIDQPVTTLSQKIDTTMMSRLRRI